MEYKNQLKGLVLFAFLFLGLHVFAQFNRNQAIELVTQNIFNNQLNELNIYASKTPLSGYVKQLNGDSLQCSHSQDWVIIAQSPQYEYKSSYIFVNPKDGAYTQYNNLYAPFKLHPNFELVSQAHPLPYAQLPPAQDQDNQSFEPNDHSFAFIFCPNTWYSTWYNSRLVYNTLIQAYGYKKENILVHYAHGNDPQPGGNDMDGNLFDDDIDFSAELEVVKNNLNELAGITNNNSNIRALGKEDQLTMFFMGGLGEQGTNAPLWQFYDQYAELTEITNIIDQIECAQMTILSTIHSTNVDYLSYFTAPAACKNKYAHLSYIHIPEMYISGGRYDEYIFYWAAAARGNYSEINRPWIPIIHQTGSFPFTDYEGLEDHPGDFNPDSNNDGYVQMEEAFHYANAMHTASNSGYYFNPHPDVNGQIANTIEENQLSFQKDILTLGGVAGNIKNTSGTIKGSLVVADTLELDYCNIEVPAGSQLFLSDHSKLVFHQPSQLQIADNATLKIGDNVELNGTDPGYHAILRIIGNTEIGENLKVKNWWKFKPLYTESFVLNGVTFENSFLHNYGFDISVENSTFTDSYFWSFRGDVSISQTDFTDTEVKLQPWGAANNSFQLNHVDCVNSFIKSTNADVSFTNSSFNTCWLVLNSLNRNNTTASVSNCSFSTQSNRPGISIDDYDNFNISNNTMNGMFNGVQMNNCGYGSGSHTIENNLVYNSNVAALNLYNSISKVRNNHFHSNTYGILLYNNCQTEISGNPNANNNSQTQQIVDNSSYEIKISDVASLPWYIKYNVIIDEDNAGGESDALVYYYNNGKVAMGDIKHNYWGNNFDASVDLFPPGFFNHLPTWSPGGNGVPVDVAEEYYTLGKTQFENKDYINAKATFELVVEQYPNTRFARAAMKDLLAIEKFVANDYQKLQSYYSSNPNIQNDSLLNALSKSLANKCDEKMANWQTAIDYYESIIQNPPGFSDSIYAIIDLGHLYLKMEADSSSKSAKAMGRMPEHLPRTQKEFREKQDYLLSLLPPHSKEAKETPDLLNPASYDMVKQNSPNPFTGVTSIDIELDKVSKVNLKVNDISGRIIRDLQFEFEEGRQTIHLNLENQANGIYYYSIYLDGIFSGSRKMLLAK